MRSGNSATTGPSISALHLHLIDMGRFSLQFYTTGSNVAQKGTGCPPPRVRAGAADWRMLKRGKALISGKSRAGRHAIARVCHARDSKGNQLKNLLRYRLLGDVAVMTGCVVLCAGYAGLASGQGLPSVPGITELQKPVASTVQTVCIALNGLGGKPALATPNPNGTPAERLSNSCTLMVSTAFFNQGTPPPFDPNGNFNLKITDDQLKRGIQAIAPIQPNAPK